MLGHHSVDSKTNFEPVPRRQQVDVARSLVDGVGDQVVQSVDRRGVGRLVVRSFGALDQRTVRAEPRDLGRRRNREIDRHRRGEPQLVDQHDVRRVGDCNLQAPSLDRIWEQASVPGQRRGQREERFVVALDAVECDERKPELVGEGARGGGDPAAPQPLRRAHPDRTDWTQA